MWMASSRRRWSLSGVTRTLRTLSSVESFVYAGNPARAASRTMPRASARTAFLNSDVSGRRRARGMAAFPHGPINRKGPRFRGFLPENASLVFSQNLARPLAHEHRYGHEEDR